MSRSLPSFTLLLLLVIAGGIAWSGWRDAHESVEMIQPREREALGKFAQRMQKRLEQLDQRYLTQLSELGRGLDFRDETACQTLCDEMVGIQMVELVTRTEDSTEVRRIGIDYLPPGMRGPMSHTASLDSSFSKSLADPDHPVHSASARRGWIEEPDLPMGAWVRRDRHQVVFFTIHAPALQAAYRPVLQQDRAGFERAAGPLRNHDRWAAPDGIPVAGTQLSPALGNLSADATFALRSRFGTWVLESWNERTVQAQFDSHRFSLAALGSLGLAGIGVILFIAQTRAQRQAVQRVSFVNRVSHELRTPVTNIQLNLDLAEESLPPESITTAARLGLVKQECSRLSRLIDNVLTFSRADRGQLRLQPGEEDLTPLLQNQLEAFQPAFARRGIEVRRDLPASMPARVDADAFRQIITNLLSNIEKYAPNGLATVRGQSTGGQVHLEISDQGPGIDSAHQQRIFQAFERVGDSVTEGSTGAGLGLTISRELARRMKGDLQLVVTGGDGAVFLLTLPSVS